MVGTSCCTETGRGSPEGNGLDSIARSDYFAHTVSPVLPRRGQQGHSSTGSSGATEATSQTPWGAIVVISGILAVVAVFVVAALHFTTPSDVTGATTATGGVIAALVGSYFGLRGATAAQGMAQDMMRLVEHSQTRSGAETADPGAPEPNAQAAAQSPDAPAGGSPTS